MFSRVGMMFLIVYSLLAVCVTADHKENGSILRLKDVPEAQAFIDSVEVAVIGFFETEAAHGYKEFLAAVKQMETLPVALCSEKEVWAKYGIASDTISIFRKADLHQEHLKLSEAKKIDGDGLARFMTINNIYYVTEYNQATAVGLFQSVVKTHLLLMADRGRTNSDPLQQIFRDLAPKYAGKMLFVLVNGREKSNARVLEYFSLKSGDLPRIGLYDGVSDKKWLLAAGEITTERVQDFCDSFLDGELQKQKEETPEDKTEL
ncbi:endoplasmic reticulum resident protein 27-like [Sinocyclocheilus anshuiensis]|uniref:endoplasmic reticulum resident protein 27-like n=1 Tax=Sinocyclocheilus anshuiensis TaxID=1608454 RepID=UPI0007B7F513|nr:PREDICTED: endoplasmic reticulum resident protein 27-like [Sinocyclocheilus anshuiensis]